ncbi:OmpA family protein [Pedobacter metabolipauper]|uniref:OOP family OmpA-OmpF porin n=1 Tax=Pedobacter metabolipauper TaxID=425513 RepID=A0A4R6SVX6_9SPHI|nr:OmpA family protein [Pedobacter metabolipauper]TDQ09233.1 OOP family OmpA-OmpF porin [Pedobacter metabolipauper]
MKQTKNLLLIALIAILCTSLYSCKTKKLAAKPATPAVTTAPEPAPTQPAPPAQVEKVVEKPAEVEKPDFNFRNIQFEFNSDVLKTSSFSILDKAVTEMKKDVSTSFILNGHSSAEGTPERNLSLSVDRANSVKSYLVNAGLNASRFTVKGFGEKEPVTSNTTEEGRVLNRRVEIKTN